MSKFTLALNSSVYQKGTNPKGGLMTGGIGWLAIKGGETPINGIYYVVQSVGIWEKFSDEGSITQVYLGGGFCNKKATLAAGASFGGVNHSFKIQKTERAYSFWTHLQSNDYQWSLWAVVAPNHGYFIEAWRCLDFISNRKCENQIGITNVVNDFYFTERISFPKINMYAFVGVGTTLYQEKEVEPNIHSGHPRKPFASVTALVEVGWDISYPKKDCKKCSLEE